MTPNKPAGTTRTPAGWTRWCLALAIALAATNARADVPGQVAYQGRLTKADGTTESRTVPMTFKLYESAEGGQAVWNEEHPRVALSDGHYVVYLGSLTPFTGVEFDGRERWLELTVDGSALVPRQKLVSVPYAVRAREAQALKGGAVDATSIAINGNVVIDGQGKLAGNARYVAGSGVSIDPNTRAISLATGCDRDQVLKWSGTAWICAEDGGASYGAGDGLQLSNGQFSIKSSCQANQILKWNGGSWACAADANETIVPGAGLTKTGSTLGLTAACAPNQILKWSGADWACAADGGNTYAAGNGLRLNGAAFGIMPCAADETIKYDGASWTCAADLTGTYRVATGSGLELNANNGFSLRRDCQPGEILAWSGTAWTCAPDADTATSAGAGLVRSGNSLALRTCAIGQVLKHDGSTWVCAEDTDTPPAAGAGLVRNGNSLALAACPAGQILKSDGTTWACAVDANTAAATPGLGLERAGAAIQMKSSCADGEILKWNGSDWACAADANAAYRAQTGGGLVLGTGNQLSLLRSCDTDEVLSWDGTAWVCAADKDTTYLAGTGLALAGRTFSLTKSCAADEVLKWSGTAWVCATDSAGTYTAGGGLTLSGGVFSLMSSCSSGQILKWNGTWTCASDADTTYSAGDGLSLTGTTLSLKTGCSAGQVLKWNGGQWACANDLDTSASYTAGSGLQLTASSFSLNLTCTSGQILKWNGTAWACAADANDAALTAGLGIKITSGTISVDNTACNAGEALTWNGTAWDCEAPVNDTRYYTKAQIDANASTSLRKYTVILGLRSATFCPSGWTADPLNALMNASSNLWINIQQGSMMMGGAYNNWGGGASSYQTVHASAGVTTLCWKTFNTRGRPHFGLISLNVASPAASFCPSGWTYLPTTETRANDNRTTFIGSTGGAYFGGINTDSYSLGGSTYTTGQMWRDWDAHNSMSCFKVMGVEEDPETKYGVFPVQLFVNAQSACPTGYTYYPYGQTSGNNNWTYLSSNDNATLMGGLRSWGHWGENYNMWQAQSGANANWCFKFYPSTGGQPYLRMKEINFGTCPTGDLTISVPTVSGVNQSGYIQRTSYNFWAGNMYDWAGVSANNTGWWRDAFSWNSPLQRLCLRLDNVVWP